MRPPWTPSLYRTNDAQTPSPPTEAVPRLLNAVDAASARLETDPYNPQLWTERAGLLLRLNYPELAAGDAYKAVLLFSGGGGEADWYARAASPHDNAPPATEQDRIATYTTLCQALYDAHCHLECHVTWHRVAQDPSFPALARLATAKAQPLRELLVRKEQAATQRGGSAWQLRDRVRDGSVLTVRYAWLAERHCVRSAEVVRGVNEELKANVQPPACRVGKSRIAGGEDVLGVFAARGVKRGECILVDRTTTCAASAPSAQGCSNCYDAALASPVRVSCCAALFCSETCRHAAMQTHHSALCGQDFSWLTAPAAGLTESASPMRPLLMLRFLALCVAAGPSTHPLDHPLIARLQPLANRGHLDVFTLCESIATPLRILHQLNIDIFRTRTFTTQTLHTLWTRLANNKAGSYDPELGFVDAITPFLPLFNHSCAPNVEYKKEAGTSTVRFFALRDVEVGEELFDSYVDVENTSRGERLERLWPWFEGGCACARCKREEEEEEEEEEGAG